MLSQWVFGISVVCKAKVVYTNTYLSQQLSSLSFITAVLRGVKHMMICQNHRHDKWKKQILTELYNEVSFQTVSAK